MNVSLKIPRLASHSGNGLSDEWLLPLERSDSRLYRDSLLEKQILFTILGQWTGNA